jgi:hypothetical protein
VADRRLAAVATNWHDGNFGFDALTGVNFTVYLLASAKENGRITAWDVVSLQHRSSRWSDDAPLVRLQELELLGMLKETLLGVLATPWRLRDA